MLPKHGDIQTMGQLGWFFQSAAVLPERCAVTTANGVVPLPYVASIIGHRHLLRGTVALLEQVKEIHSSLSGHTPLNDALQLFASPSRNCPYHHKDLLEAQATKTIVTDAAYKAHQNIPHTELVSTRVEYNLYY